MSNVKNLPMVMPSISLDFAKAKVLHPLGQSTRASTSTSIDDAGAIKTLENNQIRLRMNPVSKAIEGLHLYPARTNQYKYSTGIGELASSVALGSNTTIAPNGVTIQEITETAVYDEHYVCSPAPAEVAGKRYVISTYVKKSAKTIGDLGICLRFAKAVASIPAGYGIDRSAYFFPDGDTFRITNGDGVAMPNDPECGVEYIGSGWSRIWVSMLAPVTSSNIFARIQICRGTNILYTGAASYGMFCWGHQFEEGWKPTPLIPTSGAMVTTAAEGYVLTDNVESFNAREGTLFVEYIQPELDGNWHDIVMVGKWPYESVNRYCFVINREGGFSSHRTADGYLITGNCPAPGTLVRAAVAYSDTELATFILGSGSRIPRGTKLAVSPEALMCGCSYSSGAPSSSCNTLIRKIAYYPKMLTDQELALLTK